MNNLKIFAILTIAISSLNLSCTDNNKTTGIKNNPFIPQDTTWKTMSLREKIGQTMVIVSQFYNHKQFEGKDLHAFFEKYPVGGIFPPDWYYKYNAPQDSGMVYYIKESIKEYAAASKYPMIFMEDFERGLGLQYSEYTHMPVEMSLGAANSEELAFNFGKSVAIEARDIGMNYLLHPVVDLNMNPLHSLVNERAISDDAERAIPLLKKQIDGMHSQNIITCIKHFPGDGATMRDQHLMTASNTLDWKTWKKTYGKVFQTLIDYGAASVMVGHLTFPAYQKEKFEGHYLPATLSKELITNLLKKEMNFKGVVISDALNMGGAAGYYANELEVSVKCFEAGVDLMLWPSLLFMDSLEARILRNEIPMSRLDDAVERIWAMKERFGLLDKDTPLFTPFTKESKEFVTSTAQAVAEHAVTLVRKNDKLLPLDTANIKTILLVNISDKNKSQLFEYTKKLLENKGFEVQLCYGLSFFNWNWRMDSLKYFDRIIACFENKYFDPVGIPYLKAIEAESVWTLNMLPKEQIIGISYSNPYYLTYYFQHVAVLINAYSSDKNTQEAVVKALTGEIPFSGTSPVMLEHDILK